MELTEERKQNRTAMRKRGIAARDAIAPETRVEWSEQIARRIAESEEFKQAQTIMIYKAVRGEVRLEALENCPSAKGKCFVYPLCTSSTEMEAFHPNGADAWKKGSFGIPEPIPEKSRRIAPEEIDLVICPCTVFDEHCARMGMGAGYYDRYLEKCVNARIVSVAFEAQKADRVPMDPWDRPMEKTYTEKTVYPK